MSDEAVPVMPTIDVPLSFADIGCLQMALLEMRVHGRQAVSAGCVLEQEQIEMLDHAGDLVTQLKDAALALLAKSANP